MNTARLNFTRLNTSVLNSSVLNSSLMGGRGKGSSSRPSGLIAQYKPYLNSNDSPTRDILKDYSGHGNDVVLHNFAYAGMSGYGGYSQDFSRWEFVKTNGVKDAFSFTITGISEISEDKIRFTRGFSVGDKLKFKLKISGIPSDMTDFMILNESTSPEENHFLSNGINEIELEIKDDGRYSQVYFIGTVPEDLRDNLNIKIEQLPLYPGTLVSDGVDDYGLCETFPILTKENGYTVCILRKTLSDKKSTILISNSLNWDAGSNVGAFNIEYVNYLEQKICRSFGGSDVVEFTDSLFTFQKTNSYNGIALNAPNNLGQPYLRLFKDLGNVGSYALYALEIYDRDLSEEEIEKVKQRMIAEYEKATGNILEPEENIWLFGDGDTVLWSDGTNVLTE